MAKNFQNTDWVEARAQGAYTAYWHGSYPNLYLVTNAAGSTTYFMARRGNADYPTLDAAWAAKAALPYKEYTDWIDGDGNLSELINPTQ